MLPGGARLFIERMSFEDIKPVRSVRHDCLLPPEAVFLRLVC